MKNKGITLVALVVTIIILLILAGISISALTNQGLFTQAQNAKNITEEKTAEENEILTNYLEQMNAIIGGQVTESIPDGAVVTPINDITTWLKTGGISKQYSYTTIEQVIADSTCTKSLMNNENAMKYLARSTEFADAICASETTMTSLGQSAYVDDTVLNSDSWKQSIKASQYWALVYASKTVTVYGAASETITIEGYYGSFATGTDGSCSHVVPIDTITLTGSVSGQSFVRTVTNDTTSVYVMPEGAIYWYGKNSDNFSLNGYGGTEGSGWQFTKNADNMYIMGYYGSTSSWNGCSAMDNVLHSIDKYTKMYVRADVTFPSNPYERFQIGIAKGNNGRLTVLHTYNTLKWISFPSAITSYNKGTTYLQCPLTEVETGLYMGDLESARNYYPDIFSEDGWYVVVQATGWGGKTEAYINEIWFE